MSWEAKEFVRPVCDRCAKKGDSDEYTWWEDEAVAEEQYGEIDWFFRSRLIRVERSDKAPWMDRRYYETIEIVCPDCLVCEVCGEKENGAYEVDDHLVCGEHEDHEFPSCPDCKGEHQDSRPTIIPVDGGSYICANDFHRNAEKGLFQHLGPLPKHDSEESR